MSPRLFAAPLKNRAFIGAIVSLRRITRTIITNSKLARTLAMPSDQQAATARGAAVPPPICPAHGAECANQHTLTPLQPLREPASVELMEEEIPPANRSNQRVVARRSTPAPTASPDRSSGSTCSTCSDEDDDWGAPAKPRTKQQIEEDKRVWAEVAEKVRVEKLERYSRGKRDLNIRFEKDKYKLVKRLREEKKQLKDRYYGKRNSWID